MEWPIAVFILPKGNNSAVSCPVLTLTPAKTSKGTILGQDELRRCSTGNTKDTKGADTTQQHSTKLVHPCKFQATPCSITPHFLDAALTWQNAKASARLSAHNCMHKEFLKCSGNLGSHQLSGGCPCLFKLLAPSPGCKGASCLEQGPCPHLST